MKKTNIIILSAIVMIFTSFDNYKPIEGNVKSRVIEINFECELIGDDDDKQLRPYIMYFDLLISNNSTETLYFSSSNTYSSMSYGYFILVSPYDSFPFTTVSDNSFAIPYNSEFDVTGWHNIGPYHPLMRFIASTTTEKEEIYNNIKDYKLLFIPHLDSFNSNERKHLVFPHAQAFDLDSVIVSYSAGGKLFLYFNLGDDENGEF